MRTSGWVAIVIIIIILAGGAWWYYSMNGSGMYGATSTAGINGSPNQNNLGTATTTSGDGTGASQNLILGIQASGSLGNYLTAYNGMTLYSYSPDKATPGHSACTGSCAANWPPYTVASASAINVSAATKGTVATIARADGSMQVTYNGTPLYFYSKDTAPGQANGQGIGGVWYVVTP